MVKLVCIVVFRREDEKKGDGGGTDAKEEKAKALKIAQVLDMSSFGYFTRSKAKEFILFGSRTTCERTPSGERVTVGCGYKDYVAHSLVRSDGLAAVAVTDEEYPKDMAYQVLYLVLRDLNKKLGDKWKKVTKESAVSPPFMEKYLKDYQDPSKMDKQGKVMKEIAELKLVLKDNLHLLLERGENLDDLVFKTQDLSEIAKEFYAQSKKHNQCCKSW
mmetsp:Transcript_7855/g.19239  ORF Transcript_7855/g.19239 Transcript_7855/m.19239 type:complete len:217 (-) Transcript_7855:423-1073(-)|eukprot:CAMPEP_0114508230 /NCGR_PEP_ID=MMETSP0109-20121206/12476_1 /TAXON_ID=29199 /ORGANISM="Chlorarachnion reptans, Strain CCCM449" /LENGTH=216 /DNA_ID=CAMNT_0001687123 /DNA_START=312 /DNA_END=962 /DNA_ORIENTATION=+